MEVLFEVSSSLAVLHKKKTQMKRLFFYFQPCNAKCVIFDA